MSIGIVGSLAAVVLVGRAVTGRATGGEGAEAGAGCGGDVDPTPGEVDQLEAAATATTTTSGSTATQSQYTVQDPYQSNLVLKFADGSQCQASSQCASGYCGGGLCLPAHCQDDAIGRNGSETDINCGGGCSPVKNSAHACPTCWACAANKDCKNGHYCVDGLCRKWDKFEAQYESCSNYCGGPCYDNSDCYPGLACGKAEGATMGTCWAAYPCAFHTGSRSSSTTSCVCYYGGVWCRNCTTCGWYATPYEC